MDNQSLEYQALLIQNKKLQALYSSQDLALRQQYKEKCQEIDRADHAEAFVQTLQKELREARDQIESLNQKITDLQELLNNANHSELASRRPRSIS